MNQIISEYQDMHVCMVAYAFYESDNRVRRYAETLIKLGCHVDVLAIRKPGQNKKEMIKGVEVYRIQERRIDERNRLSYLYRLIKFLLKSFCWLSYHHMKKNFRIIHVHSVPDFEVFSTILPKLMNAKIILDIHDIVPEFYADKFKVDFDHPVVKILRIIERICCSYVDHVIIANDIWREKLIQRAVSPEKCTTIMNYPDTDIFSNRTDDKSRCENTVMVYPGTLAYHQGVDIAIRATRLIRDSIPDFEFHIYGKGPEKNELQKLIIELGLSDVVFMYEPVSMEQIAQKLHEADIGVVPKRASGFGNEGLSTKIFEYMAMGLPVVASKTKVDAVFPDNTLTHFTSENATELANQVVQLVRNDEIREKQIDAANIFIRKNSWDKKKYLYIDIINKYL